ncbi:MAG TPA: hypothetical protein VEZ13_06985 [Brevibacillus sp.]|nr:hypothetical protein [Brevibacillus sp.]
MTRREDPNPPGAFSPFPPQHQSLPTTDRQPNKPGFMTPSFF